MVSLKSAARRGRQRGAAARARSAWTRVRRFIGVFAFFVVWRARDVSVPLRIEHEIE